MPKVLRILKYSLLFFFFCLLFCFVMIDIVSLNYFLSQGIGRLSGGFIWQLICDSIFNFLNELRAISFFAHHLKLQKLFPSNFLFLKKDGNNKCHKQHLLYNNLLNILHHCVGNQLIDFLLTVFLMLNYLFCFDHQLIKFLDLY